MSCHSSASGKRRGGACVLDVFGTHQGDFWIQGTLIALTENLIKLKCIKVFVHCGNNCTVTHSNPQFQLVHIGPPGIKINDYR